MFKGNNKKRTRWLWIGVGLVLVAAVVGIALIRSSRASAAPASQTTGDEIVAAFVGDLAARATAGGQVVAQREARLALTTSGTVAEVLVEVGDPVQAGDPLLQLDTAALERAVATAEQNLVIQEANLAALQAPPPAADLAAAEASVARAQASLDDLLDGPNADELASAEAGVRAAAAEVGAAVARLDAARGGASAAELQAAEMALAQAQAAATQAAEQHSAILVTEPNQFLSEETLADWELAARAAAVQANAQLAAAQETLDLLLNGDANAMATSSASVALAVAQQDAAQARLDLLRLGAAEAPIKAAEATLAQAQAALDRLRRGPSPSQIAMAEIQVENARISWQRAQNNLAAATLVAPFDGRITAVHASPGEQANGILIEMVDDNNLEVVLEVDEVDVGEIQVGQPAVVTLEAWPNETITSEVTAIAPAATTVPGSNLVTYQVYLSLAQTEAPVRVGMTADASLETSRREGVLLVPSAAITVDRAAGTYRVTRVETDAQGNSTYRTVPVSIGLHNDRYTQITGGLREGDQLLVSRGASVESAGPRPGARLFGGNSD
ncbi:MAG: efflux RND transporter periplasmic adaptor subunit [Chloroflexota bacterium]